MKLHDFISYSFSLIILSRFITVAWVTMLFPCIVNVLPLYSYYKFAYLFISWWTFGFFLLCTIMNNAAHNIYKFLCGHKNFQLYWVYTERVELLSLLGYKFLLSCFILWMFFRPLLLFHGCSVVCLYRKDTHDSYFWSLLLPE
jgi:hypothetical protein